MSEKTTAESLERIFRFKKDGTTVNLPDPNPEMSIQEVIDYYAPQYPELTTATFEATPKTEGNQSVYSVKTTFGPKR